MANGYFQVDIRENGSYVILFPSRNGGQPIRFDEMVNYLISNKLTAFKKPDLKQACDAIEQVGKPTMLRVGDRLPYSIRENMACFISEDKMVLKCRFFAPSVHGEVMDLREIVQTIQGQGIRFGIDDEAISQFITNRRYCTDIVLAKGRQPVHGKDAEIEYFFNTSPNTRPAMNEDGTVDYKHLDNIAHVHEGDMLARIIPEDPGAPGVDLFSNVIQPRQVKQKKLNVGNNIRMSEDGLTIYSMVTGHASLVGGQVFVSDIYEIPADVDNSTGDVTYSGNVSIKGNVKSGFSVVTSGDIVVDGVVEGATLKAGGQIILKRGVQGMGKAVLKAEGSICAKFIEGANVVSGGYIETESIIHSVVTAKDEINVTGRKGYITGGRVQAGISISAKKIGSPMGATTLLEVGMSLENKERYNALKADLSRMGSEINKAYPILNTFMEKTKNGEKFPPKTILYIKQLAAQTKTMEARIKEYKAEYMALEEEMSHNSGAYVEVSGVIYAGVDINISNTRIVTSSERSYCRFTVEDGEIKVSNL